MKLGAPFRSALMVSLLVSGALASLAAEPELPTGSHVRPRIGDKLTEMTFKDIHYLPRSLRDLVSPNDAVQKRGFVLVFVNNTCPLVQKYLPRLKELDERYRDRGIQVVAVNVGLNDSILEMAAQAVKYEAAFPFVKDRDGSCVRACGVERTPEVVLIDSDYRLRYRGRIDNQYRLSGTVPASTQDELCDTIESLLADRKIETTETPVDGCVITLPTKRASASNLTFADVSDLFTQHCQACHQLGTSAPFPLTNYEEISANAAMIAEVVDEQRMPPWYGSQEFGTFTNCRKLSDKDRETMLAWIAAGAKRGDVAASKDPEVTRVENSWRMGEPDLILTNSTTYKVPETGFVDYKYALLSHVFWQDTWIQAAEVLPDNPRVLHHCNMGFIPLASGLRNARLVTGYVPGGGPLELKDGVAIKIPAYSMLVMQIHLTTTGKPETCNLKAGLRFAKQRVQKQLNYLELSNESFKIPPFASFHPVERSRTVDRNITVTGLFAHMHLRGKDITFQAFPPQQTPETMLMVPNYHFDWQMPYFVPAGTKKYAAGTRFQCVAHFDNSTFNAYNPDPAAEVHVGDQTINEMMFGFVFYTDDAEQLNLAVDPKTGHVVEN